MWAGFNFLFEDSLNHSRECSLEHGTWDSMRCRQKTCKRKKQEETMSVGAPNADKNLLHSCNDRLTCKEIFKHILLMVVRQFIKGKEIHVTLEFAFEHEPLLYLRYSSLAKGNLSLDDFIHKSKLFILKWFSLLFLSFHLGQIERGKKFSRLEWDREKFRSVF